MAMASEEKRLVQRDDALPGNPPPSPSHTHTFSKAGRRVLAELACNDSPIAGLLPTGSPKSFSKNKSGHSEPARSRRALMADTPHPACMSSLGESLLRSQVQSLLQKIGSDVSAVNAEDAPYLHFGNAMGASPTVLAVPAPLSMQVLAASAQSPPSASETAPLQDSAMEAYSENTEFLIPSSVPKAPPDSSKEMCNVASPGINFFSNTASGGAIKSLQTSSSSLQVSDTPSSTDVFVGRRILNFDDTPCKTCLEDGLSGAPSKGAPVCSSVMLQLEEDAVSEWSVNVNVGSPVDKESLIELSESAVSGTTVLPGGNEDHSMLCEHVRMMRQVSCSKVQLLWDKGNMFEEEKDNKAQGISNDSGVTEKRSEDFSDCDADERSYADQDDNCDESGECDDLCDAFMDMSFGEVGHEVGHGLPKGEGKHVRFLYEDGDDEIAEALVVSGEEDVLRSGRVIRLKGLPLPSGRHRRFAQDDEYEA